MNMDGAKDAAQKNVAHVVQTGLEYKHMKC